MSAYRTVVSSKGQVVIPAELRQRLSLEKGTPATWSEEDGRLVLTPMTEAATRRDHGLPQAETRRAVDVRGIVREERERERRREKQ